MGRRRCIGVLAAVLVSLAAGYSGLRAGPSKVEPGQHAPAFTLKDVQGNEHTLAEYLGGKCAVVMFIATQCPVSNSYNERMVALDNDYAPKGIAFVGINSNTSEDVREVREHALKHGFRFPVLKDPDNLVADEFGAQVTPEVFVIDSTGVVRYHGRIDDNMHPDEVQSRDLRTALDALLAGQQIPRTETKAFGCTIKRVRK